MRFPVSPGRRLGAGGRKRPEPGLATHVMNPTHMIKVTPGPAAAAAALITIALPGLWRYDARNQPGAGPGQEDQPAVAPGPEPSTVPSGP
jgi:hypothetical protein